MAIFSSTLMTRAKGSIGNLTLVTSKGRMIAKQKISIMSNPRTERQLSQRSALALAVAMWQYIGAVIKSGITVYPQFGSQYNGFVNQNIAFLKNSTIDPTALRNQDLVGVKATNGNLGAINFVSDEILSDSATFNYPTGALKNIAKVGDKVKLVIGSSLQSEMGYFERELTAADLASSMDFVRFSDDFSRYSTTPVYTLWVETADGTKSTSSVFKSEL